MGKYTILAVLVVCGSLLAVSVLICAGVLYQTYVLHPHAIPAPGTHQPTAASRGGDSHLAAVHASMPGGHFAPRYHPHVNAAPVRYRAPASSFQEAHAATGLSYAHPHPHREEARANAGGYRIDTPDLAGLHGYDSRFGGADPYERGAIRTAVLPSPGHIDPRSQPGSAFMPYPPSVPVTPELDDRTGAGEVWGRNGQVPNGRFGYDTDTGTEFHTPAVTNQTGPSYLQAAAPGAPPPDDAAKTVSPAASQTSLPSPGQGRIPIHAGVGYGRVKGAPVPGRLPVRMSTERLISDTTIDDYLAPTQVTHLQPRPDPTGGILEPVEKGWRVSATGIEWMRTDYGVNSGSNSGRNDRISTGLRVAKLGDHLDWYVHTPFEYNRTSGALTPYSFIRLGAMAGPKAKILQESRGDFVDVEAGGYLTAFRNFAIDKGMKDSAQYGPVFAGSIRKRFKPVDLGFAASYSHTLKQNASLPLETGLHLFKLKLTAGVPLGEQWVLNNHFEVNTAPNSKGSDKTWIDFGTGITYMMTDTMFLHFNLGADTDVAKSWHGKFGLDYVLKF